MLIDLKPVWTNLAPTWINKGEIKLQQKIRKKEWWTHFKPIKIKMKWHGMWI